MKSELFQLTGRTALITGGGSGLGRAISLAFAETGARVAVADISLETAVETAKMIAAQGGDAFAERLDVTQRPDVEALTSKIVQRWGSLDILVNSAGRAIRGTALDYKEEDWTTIIDVNLTGTFFCCQAAGRHMASQRRGKIINFASIGSFVAYPGSIAYLASKGGVIQLTKRIRDRTRAVQRSGKRDCTFPL